LYKACANKRKDIAALLVERGANLSLGPACNRPPLVRAAEDGNDIYIHMLLDSEELRTGDDSKGDQSENAESALFAACKRGHAAVVRSLVGYGADLNCVNDEGKTMLHVAAKEGPRGHGMLSALIQLGIDLDIIDKVFIEALLQDIDVRPAVDH
jgi:ankyrin repeat protein